MGYLCSSGFEEVPGMRRIILVTFALLAVSACSSEGDAPEASEEHVWKGQVEAIDKAREVETILQRDQQRLIQQQGQQ